MQEVKKLDFVGWFGALLSVVLVHFSDKPGKKDSKTEIMKNNKHHRVKPIKKKSGENVYIDSPSADSIA